MDKECKDKTKWILNIEFDKYNNKHLDFNTNNSITFDNHYIGSMPCMPARRDMQSGRLSFLHRSWGPLEPFDNSFPEILHEAGVPSGVFNLVNGLGPEVGEAMSSHPDIDMMSFTGSTRGGVAVAKASADSVKRVSQELGGKSPNIILDDDHFEKSVMAGVELCMNNTGQSCNAPTRMLVPESRKEEAFVLAIKEAENTTVGDPKANDTTIGPLVSDIQFNKVQTLIDAGVSEGATLLVGGTGKPDGLDKGYYVKPTVFGDVTNDMTIAREEIFGPYFAVFAQVFATASV